MLSPQLIFLAFYSHAITAHETNRLVTHKLKWMLHFTLFTAVYSLSVGFRAHSVALHSCWSRNWTEYVSNGRHFLWGIEKWSWDGETDGAHQPMCHLSDARWPGPELALDICLALKAFLDLLGSSLCPWHKAPLCAYAWQNPGRQNTGRVVFWSRNLLLIPVTRVVSFLYFLLFLTKDIYPSHLSLPYP